VSPVVQGLQSSEKPKIVVKLWLVRILSFITMTSHLMDAVNFVAQQDVDVLIAYSSPVLYIVYVEVCKLILPRENKENKHIFDILKLLHNLGLSFASLLMLIGILHTSYRSGKLVSVHAALCGPYVDEKYASLVGWYFYLSKYWEWGDTAFLISSRKEITWLQYTHHMSTAVLVFANIYPILSAASLLACFTNTFVHVFMYLYFAFPKGILKRYRQWITIIQIIQHCACLSGFLYIYANLDNCVTTTIGIEMSLMLYAMYLTFFVLFYIMQYVQNDVSKLNTVDKAGKKAK
jgi:hypothetical protein